jgi:cell wall-associated NlpC family hydrolase
VIETTLRRTISFFFCITAVGCQFFPDNERISGNDYDTAVLVKEHVVASPEAIPYVDATQNKQANIESPDTAKLVSPDKLLRYAKTLIGTPYKYASIDPLVGLDCSGFITHVFNQFSIKVPRSSIDFTNYGISINSMDAVPGDLILFTGTDSLSEVVGHMGIVTGIVEGVIEFIHSTSGKAYGVTVTTLNAHYRKRFVKVIRIPYSTTRSL